MAQRIAMEKTDPARTGSNALPLASSESCFLMGTREANAPSRPIVTAICIKSLRLAGRRSERIPRTIRGRPTAAGIKMLGLEKD